MKVGDIVKSRNPLIDSFGVGIIVSKFKTKKRPPQYTIYWSESNKISKRVSIDLWRINESR